MGQVRQMGRDRPGASATATLQMAVDQPSPGVARRVAGATRRTDAVHPAAVLVLVFFVDFVALTALGVAAAAVVVAAFSVKLNGDGNVLGWERMEGREE